MLDCPFEQHAREWTTACDCCLPVVVMVVVVSVFQRTVQLVARLAGRRLQQVRRYASNSGTSK